MEAAAVLRNSGNPVRLVFGRLKTQEGVDERETEEEETGKTGTGTYQGLLPNHICWGGENEMQWQKYNNNIVSSATACFRKRGGGHKSS